MSEAFVAEIRIFGFNFAPRGWAQCNGQILPISQNTALFSLLGTTYGGNGQTNFALPNLQGRAPMQPGQGPGLSQRSLGEEGGTETVTLLQTEMPAHNHGEQAATQDPADETTPGPTKTLALSFNGFAYGVATGNVTQMSPQTIASTGGGQPHNNLMPYQTLNFCIALQGIFPARN